MYKLLKDGSGVDRDDVILRTSDKAFIPNDASNKDWIAYQEWLSLGNVPEASE